MTASTRQRLRARAWISLVLLAGLLIAATRWRLHVDSEKRFAIGAAVEPGLPVPAAEGLAIPVAVDTVRQGSLILQVSATGQTEASDRATVAARVAGRIAALPVTESDPVGRGQVVARMDAREYVLAVRQVEAELAEAEARYREMTLFDDRIEDPAILGERTQAARAKSGLDRAEIALSRAQLDLANTALTAPFAGHVANVLVGEGGYVASGEEILSVVDVDPVLVEVQVVESELRWLAEGGMAAITVAAFPDSTFRGRIRSINPVVDPETRTARVTVVLANPDGRILPGMFARVSLEGRAFEDRIMVPKEAIVERDDRTLVFVLEPIPDGPPGLGLVKWVYVTTGLANDRYVELVEREETEIPEPRSLVITGGNYTLIHDARVRIASDAGMAEEEGP
ncbi:MAG: efflux RND transporter periplasmic adaptor subunit [Gemmatimonadota bacterium]